MTTSAKAKILIVEDDRSLREGLAMNLRLKDYETITASNGDEGMKRAFNDKPDLIILDIMMPGWSGLEIVEELRKRGQNTPVLILSALGTVPDKITGLNLGADDYMSKPFDLPELLARVAAMLRRVQNNNGETSALSFGPLSISKTTREATLNNKKIKLSAKEFDILYLFASSPGQVFTREQILQQVWGWDYEGTERTVDNYVVSLRKKLENSKSAKKHITTIPRVGYSFNV